MYFQAIKQILQEYDAKEMGTSTVQLLQDDMLEKPEEQPPMSTDGRDFPTFPEQGPGTHDFGKNNA